MYLEYIGNVPVTVKKSPTAKTLQKPYKSKHFKLVRIKSTQKTTRIQQYLWKALEKQHNPDLAHRRYPLASKETTQYYTTAHAKPLVKALILHIWQQESSPRLRKLI